ncbi:MAG TPA: DNA primase [Terriglobales bacterium]|jgi:DNA primase|nr:DNA primase [Terriglobales bacterium]
MALASDFAQTLKQQADIVRVVGDYLSLKKAGAQNYSGLCPFHKEKTPSFSVHATRQFFHCFGCGKSGDVFKFVQEIENISFPEAIRVVAQKMGVELPKASFSSESEARDAKLRTALLEIHERASSFFQECLWRSEGAKAREYLIGRNLDEATIRKFRIGLAPDSGFLLRDRLKNEFGEEMLRESGLFSWKENPSSVTGRLSPENKTRFRDSAGQSSSGSHVLARNDVSKDHGAADGPRATMASMYSKFRNRIMFPIANDGGRVIAFTGRTLLTDEKAGPKYLNSPETAIYSKSRVLFNLDQAKEAIRALNYAILVEGQMDCISVFAAGFHNVIASSGTAFTPAQAALLGRFSKQVVVNFDPDAAGAKATERTLGLLVEEEFEIRVLTLEQGFDPDLFVRRKGKEAYAGALKLSQRYFDYLIERARGQFPVRSAEGKLKAVNYLLPHIQRVPSRIVRDELAQEIAQKLSVDSAVLRQELKNAAISRKTTEVKAVPETQVTDAEKLLIRALASGDQSESYSSDRSGADDPFDPARQAKYFLASERLHLGLSTEALIETLLNAPENTEPMDLSLSDSDRGLLATILIKHDEELTADKVDGAARALRRLQIKRRLEQIQRQLESMRTSDSAQIKALMDEKIRLKKMLMTGAAGENDTSAAD